MSQSNSTARRKFIKFLAASPYVAALGGVAAFFEQTGFAQSMQQTSDVITSPAGAFDVFDFEEAAHRKVLQGHWAYMASGVDDDATLRANRDGFKHVELRPRRLRDATKVDMHVELFGTMYNSPIFTCPVGEAHVRWDRHEWSAHFRSFDGLEFRRSHAQILERQIY